MSDLDASFDALRRAAEDRATRQGLTARVDEADALARSRAEELRDLQARLRVEEADVRRIEGLSPARLWATLRGDAEEKAARERAERDAAARAVAGATERADRAARDVAALRERRAALGDVDARYAAALAAHEAVMSREGGTAASNLRIVAADIGQAAAELREVDEAIAAERTASDALAEAFSSLQSAGGWSTYDTFFGGGMIADLMKHSRIEESSQAFARVNRALERLRVELADIGVGAVQGVEISQSLAVFDVLFDNLFSDWMVRDRIARAKDEAVDLQVRLSELARTLAERRLAVAQRLVDLGRRREALLLGAG